jgi:ATP-dependent exoDNAse (exonuclease V) alpha subunit
MNAFDHDPETFAKPTIELTPEQQDAVFAITDMVENREASVLALKGPAGTGKTTCIKQLARNLPGCTLAATTNKAAVRLRHLTGMAATTAHKASLKPVWREPYLTLERWVADSPEFGFTAEWPDPPAELYKHFSRLPEVLKKLRKGDLNSNEIITALGVDPFNYFERWTSRDPDDDTEVLICDEASMLDAETLHKILGTFRSVVLVRDDFQLPPIGEGAIPAFSQVEFEVHLEKIHRQAEGSPIIQLAHRIRNREPFEIPQRNMTLEDFERGVPVLCWTNSFREGFARNARKALGRPGKELVPGEALVCRSNLDLRDDFELNSHEFLNNAVYQVEDWSPHRLQIVNDIGESVSLGRYGMEDWNEPYLPQFRLGYAMTCWTAQGSEWPVVGIATSQWQAYSRHRETTQEQARRWLYTAVTRAKEEVFFFNRVTA